MPNPHGKGQLFSKLLFGLQDNVKTEIPDRKIARIAFAQRCNEFIYFDYNRFEK